MSVWISIHVEVDADTYKEAVDLLDKKITKISNLAFVEQVGVDSGSE